MLLPSHFMVFRCILFVLAQNNVFLIVFNPLCSNICQLDILATLVKTLSFPIVLMLLRNCVCVFNT